MITTIKIALLTFMSLFLGSDAATGVTPHAIGPGRIQRDFVYTGVNSGKMASTDFFVIDQPILAYATATGAYASGSTLLLPKSICIPNPITKYKVGTGTGTTPNLNLGSGAILSAIYHNVVNPAGVSGDLGFSDDCDIETASGATLIDNVCTGSGCTSKYFPSTASSADWNGAKYLTLTLNGDPTAAFRAAVSIMVQDIVGE